MASLVPGSFNGWGHCVSMALSALHRLKNMVRSCSLVSAMASWLSPKSFSTSKVLAMMVRSASSSSKKGPVCAD